jgi:peptidyl-prolyl cis-trans isomerase C
MSAIEFNPADLQAAQENSIELKSISTDQNPDIYINGVNITESDVLQEMQYHPATDQRNAMIVAAESLIITELFKQRCLALGLIKEDDKHTEDELCEMLVTQEVNLPRTSDDECERYYEANLDRFCTSPLLEVDHILIAADKEDLDQRAEAKELSEGILEMIKQKPHTFAEMAMKHSMCPSKEHGGSLGQISKGQTVREFEKVLFLSEEGLVPSVIESRYGFHIANIHRKVDGQQMPLEHVESKIKVYLDEKVRRKAIAQYIELLIADANITGFEFDVTDSPLVQ